MKNPNRPRRNKTKVSRRMRSKAKGFYNPINLPCSPNVVQYFILSIEDLPRLVNYRRRR